MPLFSVDEFLLKDAVFNGATLFMFIANKDSAKYSLGFIEVGFSKH